MRKTTDPFDDESGPFVSMKVRESLYFDVVEIAKEEDRTITAIVRRAVRMYQKAKKR